MTKNVIACQPATSVKEAARLMYLNGLTGLPVLDEQDRVIGIITEQDLVKIEVHDLRKWGEGERRNVDDRPYGGGAGMVMAPQPILRAVEKARLAINRKKENKGVVVVLSAKGKQFAFEMFGYRQYTYFFIGCDADMVKLIEGLLYSTYPDCEIRPTKDYTRFYDPQKQVLLGLDVHCHQSDIYPFKRSTNNNSHRK